MWHRLIQSTSLTKMVEQAKKAVQGITPEGLRKDAAQRKTLGDAMQNLGTSLESMMEEAQALEKVASMETLDDRERSMKLLDVMSKAILQDAQKESN